MSWSIYCHGKKDAVIAELDRESARLTGQSKQELEEAKPHIVALIDLNCGSDVVLELSACGSASFDQDGNMVCRSVTISRLSQLWGRKSDYREV